MKWVLAFLSLAVLVKQIIIVKSGDYYSSTANAATFVLNMSPQECQEGEECSRYTKPPQDSVRLRQNWYVDDYYPVDLTYPGFDDWDWPIQEPYPEEYPLLPPNVVDEDAVSVSPDVKPTPKPDELTPAPPTVVTKPASEESTRKPTSAVSSPKPDSEESTRKPTSADSSPKPASEDSTRKPNSDASSSESSFIISQPRPDYSDSRPAPATPARNTTPATSVNEETITTPAKPNRSSFRSMPSKNRSNGSLEVRVILPPKLP